MRGRHVSQVPGNFWRNWIAECHIKRIGVACTGMVNRDSKGHRITGICDQGTDSFIDDQIWLNHLDIFSFVRVGQRRRRSVEHPGQLDNIVECRSTLVGDDVFNPRGVRQSDRFRRRIAAVGVGDVTQRKSNLLTRHRRGDRGCVIEVDGA